MKTPRGRTLRNALGAGLLALALAGCSDGGGSSGGGGDDGGGGLGGLIGGGGGTDEGEAAQNPFVTTDEGTRPDTPVTDTDPDDRPLPAFGGGDPLVPEDDDPVSISGEPVLDRLQNDFVSENEFDVWVCATPQVAELEAVGYLYVGSQGATVLVPTTGEAQSSGFTASEFSAGTVVNQYDAEVGVTETITNFAFSGSERFEATSDLFGDIGCERFFVDETTSSGGSTGTPVAARIENSLSAAGELNDIWACQGPRLQVVDANLYAFLGAQGVFASFIQGQDISDPVVFEYTESPPGTLLISYQNGDQETLGGITFTSDTAFDTTSSFDGPLSCELVSLTGKRSAAMSGSLASLEASAADVTSDILVGALAGAMSEAMED